ncbi:MAG: threonine--tRNA ligase, partial [Desulfamplus sp.]|nr:threonine--tRNA ligase [Desulfamplus sp.]
IRCEVDTRTESLKKKVRDAQVNYTPLIITIGEKERESATLSVRTLDGNVKMGLAIDEFVKPVIKHIKDRVLEEIVL